MSREARINAMLPERRGPILSLLVRRGLHILPPRLPAILAACAHQLSRPALADFTASQAARELRPPDSDLGVLECLPREILLQVVCGSRTRVFPFSQGSGSAWSGVFVFPGYQCSDPDPHVFGPAGSASGSISERYGSGSGSVYQQAKILRITSIPTVLWLLLDYLSLKTDVNVPSKSNKQNNFLKNSFLFASWRSMPKIAGSISQRHGSADPDPQQNIMDPEHCRILITPWIKDFVFQIF